MKNTKLLLTLVLAAATLVSTSQVRAQDTQYGQYGQYGGNIQSQSVTIDKKVARPGTTDYVDNLLPSDPRYVPGQHVNYQIKVRNTTNGQITNITVTDTIPNYLEPIEGPGSYNSGSRTITFTVGTLNAGEEKVYTMKMQVVGQDRLPSDRSLICETAGRRDVTNRADVYVAGTQTDGDTAQLCIEKTIGTSTTGTTVSGTSPGLAIRQVPSTGPEFGIALVALQMAGLGAGIYLKRRTA